MNIRIINFSAIFLLAIGLLACSDDDSSLPGNHNASLLMKSGDNRLKSLESITFSEAIIHVDEVEFESLEVDDDDYEIDFDGPFEIDLLTGKSVPEIPTTYLRPGKYEEVEVELDDDVSPNITIVGQAHIDEANVIDFVFRGDEDIDFEAEAEDVEQPYLFEVAEGERIDIVMEFQLDEWFKGVDFTSASTNDDDVVVISKDHNQALYLQIVKNIEDVELVISTK